MQNKLLDTAGFNQLAATRYGYLLYNQQDIYVGGAIAQYGEYGEHEVQLFRQLLQEGDVVVEVGANIGSQTLPLARIVGPTGFVYAFEPQRVVFQTLAANIALNSLMNVECMHAAVGREPGSLLIPDLDYAVRANYGGVSVNRFSEGRPVRVVTLDDTVPPERVTLLKIDVEGMEAEVLAGAGQLIAAARPVLYVENDRREKSPALIDAILAMDYRAFWHLPLLYHPDNFYQNQENIYPGIVSVNMVCFPREWDLQLEGFIEVNGRDDFPVIHRADSGVSSGEATS